MSPGAKNNPSLSPATQRHRRISPCEIKLTGPTLDGKIVDSQLAAQQQKLFSNTVGRYAQTKKSVKSLFSVFFTEFIDTASRINNPLLACIEWMA